MAKKKAKKKVQIEGQDFECKQEEKTLICEPKIKQNKELHPKFHKFHGGMNSDK